MSVSLYIRLHDILEPAGPTGVIVNMTGDKIVQNEPKVDVNCYVFGAHPKVSSKSIFLALF